MYHTDTETQDSKVNHNKDLTHKDNKDLIQMRHTGTKTQDFRVNHNKM